GGGPDSRRPDAGKSCLMITPRRGVRVEIELEDWCVDFSTPKRPSLWLISGQAWYLIGGGGWWDHVAPSPAYAPVFEDTARQFRVASLVMHVLYKNGKITLPVATRRIHGLSDGDVTFEDLEEHHGFLLKTFEEAPPVPIKPGKHTD
ncbi:unnamed protein product, partial [Phaeothamnion confervicola]